MTYAFLILSVKSSLSTRCCIFGFSLLKIRFHYVKSEHRELIFLLQNVAESQKFFFRRYVSEMALAGKSSDSWKPNDIKVKNVYGSFYRSHVTSQEYYCLKKTDDEMTEKNEKNPYVHSPYFLFISMFKILIKKTFYSWLL